MMFGQKQGKSHEFSPGVKLSEYSVAKSRVKFLSLLHAQDVVCMTTAQDNPGCWRSVWTPDYFTQLWSQLLEKNHKKQRGISFLIYFPIIRPIYSRNNQSNRADTRTLPHLELSEKQLPRN